ncbi:MAG: multiprotein bridging factor aMBF1 [Candidatus Bathyarchaeia archaeon]
MRCEVCGRKIQGKPVKAIIEGAKLTVCNDCSRHGKIVLEEIKQSMPIPIQKTTSATTKTAQMKMHKVKAEDILEENLELVEDFAQRIRQARERLGLTQEDLGKKINEKASLLKKIESGKLKPDNRLAAKIEHALRIKLLIPSKCDMTTSLLPKPKSQGLTFGDLLQLGKNNGGKVDESYNSTAS